MHDVYAIIDPNTRRVFHFGETGRGYQTRGKEWARMLEREYGLEVEVVWLRTVEGKEAAKVLETRFIQTYEKVFGFKPGFVDEAGNFIPVQKSNH